MQFAGSNADNLNFVYANETFNCNVPYLMAVPQTLVGKNITFSANNVQVLDNVSRFSAVNNNNFIFCRYFW